LKITAFSDIRAGDAEYTTILLPSSPRTRESSIGYTASIELMPWVTAEAAAVGLVATIIAGVIPALRARRIAIVDALRQAS